ncbi:ion transporter [Chitiniphilus purpureus]|uniref:Ion transporter n=1 Tax=Chitiniphilus purpureus TaxID=2981137 RepID=A0ABY6DHG6_9NEIS|nr:ion transporter [Chitiniphilus sp. CD1]UXY13668.1 ion transporter [Chitiniphilus sp. CD1]
MMRAAAGGASGLPPRRRLRLLRRIERGLDLPMAALGLLWLCLLVTELVWGLGRLGTWATRVIWGVFVFDFLLRLLLAPRRLRYLRRNLLTAVTLLLPALRVLRVARGLRVLGQLRGLRLLRVLSSVNRGMAALGTAMRRRGFGYVLAITAMVAAAGAAGIYAFEKGASPQAPDSYWSALWWTAMLLTTMGSEYWPSTTEGRLLCLLLALYAFAVFGYVTGVLTTFFIGRDVQDEESGLAGQQALKALTEEMRALRAEVAQLREARPADGGAPR